MSAKTEEKFARMACTAQILWELIAVVAGMVTKFFKQAALILTSVQVKEFVPKTLFVKT